MYFTMRLRSGEEIIFLPLAAKQRRLNFWLVPYEAATPGVEASDNSTVRLDDLNEPQPDARLNSPAGT
jgi:hypothetical protein